MSDTTNAPQPSRWSRALTGLRNWWQPKKQLSEADLDAVRQQTPAPVFWLLGKTQSGKSSVVRFLTGATAAEIGSGFRPCTRHSSMFPFPNAEAPVLTFLDTRGLDEPNYNPAEDLASFGQQAHLLLVTCRCNDFATGNLRAALAAIRAANPDRRAVLLLTCLHEAYPQQQHPQPYPDYAAPSDDPRIQAIQVLIIKQRELFADLIDDIVPIDLTQPEEGYDDSTYGGAALQQHLLDLLPEAYQETLRHLVEAEEQFRDRQQTQAAPVLVGYSTLAATAGAIPIPFVDLLILPAIQTRMIHELAKRSSTPHSSARFLELSASAGIGLLAAVALRQMAKLIPYVGSLLGAGLAGASTYALGRAYLEYDRRVNDGHLPDKTEVAAIYQDHLSKAKKSWASTGGTA
jgi:uncharacterized protein (DUF697 family)